MTGLCGHPVILVEYRDDLTGEMVKRWRCERCEITYIPEEAQ